MASNGNLVLSNAGTITGAGLGLTLDGSNTASSLASILGTGAGTLTKAGAGTWTLSGANTYTGATAISAGTLKAANNNALGTTGGGTTVATGATLEIDNGIAIGAEALTVSGPGAGSRGALIVNSGSASYGGAITLGANAGIGGNGSLTLGGAVNDASPGTSTLTQVGSGTLTFLSAVGAVNALAAVATSAGQTTAINGGSIRTTGAQSYGGSASTSGVTTLTSTGSGDIAAGNAGNNFNGNLVLSTGGAASVVDSSALALGASSVGTLSAQTLSGDLTLNGTITATGGGDSIVLAAGGNFINAVGAGALVPGAGRWLVYSTSPAGSTENGLTGAAGSTLPRLYGRTYAGDPPASIASGNHLVYSFQPTLAVTPDNKTKVYGSNDPVQTYGAAGHVVDDGVTDTATTAGLAGSFGRAAGESVGDRAITQGSFASGARYAISFAGGQTLGITQAGLTATVANQTKTYGGDDPSLGGAGVTLSGLVNNAGIVTWNGAVGVNDSALTSTATALTRVAGEDVGSRSITAGSFTTPSGNYSAPTLVAGSTLGITPASLAVTAGDASRPAGAANPAFSAIFSGFKLLD